jgi:hypothetical protein
MSNPIPIPSIIAHGIHSIGPGGNKCIPGTPCRRGPRPGGSGRVRPFISFCAANDPAQECGVFPSNDRTVRQHQACSVGTQDELAEENVCLVIRGE